MKSWEYTALEIKNERQKSYKVKVTIEDDDTPEDGFRCVSSNHWIAVYGRLTEEQHRGLLQHLDGYIKLLLEEYDKGFKFRREWDAEQDRIDNKELA